MKKFLLMLAAVVMLAATDFTAAARGSEEDVNLEALLNATDDPAQRIKIIAEVINAGISEEPESPITACDVNEDSHALVLYMPGDSDDIDAINMMPAMMKSALIGGLKQDAEFKQILQMVGNAGYNLVFTFQTSDKSKEASLTFTAAELSALQ